MNVICLDLEGVLVPEIWINFAEKTGIEALKKTTRDEPDYDVLMNYRLDILKENNLKLQDVQEVIAEMKPLDGAKEFLDTIQAKSQVVILSDTFTQFAHPLMKQLDFPTLFCNELVVEKDGTISGYRLRQQDGKRKAVQGFHSMNLKVFAAGDSYNDLTMILEADKGLFFRPPVSITEENPQVPVARDHKEMLDFFLKAIEE